MQTGAPSCLKGELVAEKAYTPKTSWRLMVGAAFALAFLVIDQLSKEFVRSWVAAHGLFFVHIIPGVVHLEYVENTGVAFGLASGFGYAFVLLAAVVVVAVVIYLLRAPRISRCEVVGLGMLVGGAVGNAIDRAVHGFVTDFIATTFIDFPVFNIADIGITVGVVIALIGFMFLSPAARDHEADDVRKAEEESEHGR